MSGPKYALESCIKLDRITPKKFFTYGVRFDLNENVLREIERARNNNLIINISPDLLSELKYFAFIERQNILQSGIKFCTYYQKKAIIRTVIYLDGQIFQQISQEELLNPELLRITSAHYWLSEQLLQTLSLKPQRRKGWLNWFSWIISIVIVSAIALFNLEHLFPINPLKLLAILLMLFLFQWGIKRLLYLCLPSLRRWLWRQLLFNSFSRQQRIRKIAFYFLERI